VIAPLGFSSYNAFQARLDRRISSGLLVRVSYTFSKTIDNIDNELGLPMWFDPAVFSRNRALANFDRTHNFRFSWVAELPFGAGKRWAQSGIGRKVLGGWQRAESYNISNTPHFSNPSASVSSGGFMTITSALSRANNVDGGERQFRVALRISF